MDHPHRQANRPAPRSLLRIRTAGQTDVGRVREQNQDQFLIGKICRALQVLSTSLQTPADAAFVGRGSADVMLVADGMGGHAGGEKASQLAVEYLARHLIREPAPVAMPGDVPETRLIQGLVSLLRSAHAEILRVSQSRTEHHGMGTTLTMAHLVLPRMIVLHAGDSRCYLIREGIAQQLTTDHTLARKMVEAGEMKPEDEATSRWSNVLWNVLGGQIEGDLVAEVHTVDLQEGDAVVLCSDGLHRHVDAELLAMTVAEGDDPESICSELIRITNQAGGEDNVTVVVAVVERIQTGTGQTTRIDDTLADEDSFDSLFCENGSLTSWNEMDSTLDETQPE
ncbi:PP2C family protein-serine/threonine phosphatase [Novipirellula artificiosorum]|uniref:Serine/threonine phosphatase stp n=1 Tax=Novipirellula artificiosorum TaxID=2528016 RepID=A0A5C6DVR1_9BACT|nr:protein phosphatase 2C domain-containing protein [Novipirellula artificiosorum]TWU40810.1 Serine/threonine phosphatase stp [Novipirellula artificiosorum]